MSPTTHSHSPRHRSQASLFAALGDETRLALLTKLSAGQQHSITQLAHGSALTRQAVTKHLRVLERARIVRCTRSGRERLYELDPLPVQSLKTYLDTISNQWDTALQRLRAFVESDASHTTTTASNLRQNASDRRQ
ncbi:MAG: metalloregulator ArsR/SmtB family transcription factor [Acidobacteriaceae bacterium]